LQRADLHAHIIVVSATNELARLKEQLNVAQPRLAHQASGAEQLQQSVELIDRVPSGKTLKRAMDKIVETVYKLQARELQSIHESFITYIEDIHCISYIHRTCYEIGGIGGGDCDCGALLTFTALRELGSRATQYNRLNGPG
ncbi:hypothetical protein HaLaN_32031, partial [Haematococcus lacustris]